MQLDLFRYAAGPLPPTCTFSLGGRPVPYTLKRSARAKKVWLKIGIGTGLEVVAPAKMAKRELERVLEEKAGWIEKNLAKAGEAEKTKPRRRALRDGAILPYMGRKLKLKVRLSQDGGTSVTVVGRKLVATVTDGSPQGLRKAIAAWYKESAGDIITARVEKLGKGLKIGRVSIRDQKTRWGSCSSRGNLSFNWRLSLAPPAVIDYLVIHELAHLEHPDHSRRFWEKVARRCPKYKEHVAWLKEHGPWLSPW